MLENVIVGLVPVAVADAVPVPGPADPAMVPSLKPRVRLSAVMLEKSILAGWRSVTIAFGGFWSISGFGKSPNPVSVTVKRPRFVKIAVPYMFAGAPLAGTPVMAEEKVAVPALAERASRPDATMITARQNDHLEIVLMAHTSSVDSAGTILRSYRDSSHPRINP